MNRLFIVLIFLAIAGCQPHDSARASNFKTLMIKATGEVEALPDMATFRVQLNCLEKSIAVSKKCLVAKSNELNKKLLGFGIKQEDILTTAVDMHKSYNWSRSTRVLEGYNSSTVLYVTIKDLNKLDEIYTELIENRNLEIGGLSYAHSRLDSLKNEAYVKALKSSNTLADKLLTELPESEKEILKIGNVAISASLPQASDLNHQVANEAMETDAAGVGAQSRSIAISKGTVLVQATLFVEFQIR